MHSTLTLLASAASLGALALTGCAAAPIAGAAAAGAGAGAAGGAMATGGSGTAAVAGAELGGIIGTTIGVAIDKAGRERAAKAEYQALETNQPVSWSSPPHASGNVRPIRSYTRADGAECREFLDEVEIDGERQTATATACKSPNGQWALTP